MADNQRRFPRYAADEPVRAIIDEAEFEAVVRDVSAGGAFIVTDIEIPMQNDQFVALHAEGLGNRSGRVVRDVPEGFAMEFDHDEEEARCLEEELRRFRSKLGEGIA